MLDGQQRTISICVGNDAEKLSWFQVINTAGAKLTEQEAHNAIYACPWLTDAKNYFSKPNCPAHNLYRQYLNGKAIRQDYLDTALKWICDRDGLRAVENYMDTQKKKFHGYGVRAVELFSERDDVGAGDFPDVSRKTHEGARPGNSLQPPQRRRT